MALTKTPLGAKLDPGLRRAVLWVGLLNFAYFLVESIVAHWAGSVALVADSIDFLEDGLINLFVFFALGWSYRARALTGKLLVLLFVPPIVTVLVTAWHKLAAPSAPPSAALVWISLGALVINGCSTWLLLPFRHARSSFALAAFLASSNDVLANLAILLAGAITSYWPSAWPDLLVGLLIACLNGSAAASVWRIAHAPSFT